MAGPAKGPLFCRQDMKSDVINVSSMKDQTDAVMDQAEKVAVFQGLSTKGALHLRLLAEEMMSMMRAITGDVRGQFWIENEKDQFQLHLNVRTQIDFLQREKLLSASSSGKNEYHQGFLGKLRAFFEPIEGTPVYFDSAVSTAPHEIGWSMNAYQEQLGHMVNEKREGAVEAWDELEKSVIAHVADEVKISIHGCDVEMIVFKKI